MISKHGNPPACIQSKIKTKLIEMWRMSNLLSNAQQIIKHLKHGPQSIDEIDAKYIETPVLMDKTVANSIIGTEKSHCEIHF